MNEQVAKALCDAEVVQFGVFEYASGRKGPIYVDLRKLPSYPESMGLVADELGKLCSKLDVDVVAGAETAGIPYAAFISLKTKLPMVYVRKRPKGYGTQSMIEGVLKKGQKTVLVDDLITSGHSKFIFLDGIDRAEAEIQDVIVVLDRGQGGKEMLADKGVELHSLITLKELLVYMNTKDLLDDEKYRDIIGYLKNPEKWSKEH